MVKVKNNGITIYCNYDGCNNSITATSIAHISKEFPDWYIQSNQYPHTQDSIKNLWCPDCYKKHKEKQCQSEDIKERIFGGYYNKKENYSKFKPDLLKDLGIENHKKANKLFTIAWSKYHSSGWYDVYCFAKELTELIY
jgi:hypothetical protein